MHATLVHVLYTRAYNEFGIDSGSRMPYTIVINRLCDHSCQFRGNGISSGQVMKEDGRISANRGATDARLTVPASFLNDGVSARSGEKKNDRWLDAFSLV